ncbi:MAG: hypothetical protein HY744_16840 [Deltaproteobacteria bacterium]|nr:hypothetical protein [Deltaproteobacteria bacterium]
MRLAVEQQPVGIRIAVEHVEAMLGPEPDPLRPRWIGVSRKFDLEQLADILVEEGVEDLFGPVVPAVRLAELDPDAVSIAAEPCRRARRAPAETQDRGLVFEVTNGSTQVLVEVAQPAEGKPQQDVGTVDTEVLVVE